MLENKSEHIGNIRGIRKPGLTLICILTFAGSGILSLSMLLLFAIYDQIPFILSAADTQLKERELILLIENAPRYYFLIISIIQAISLTGAIIMWNLRKVGFHIYTTAQLLLLLVPFFILPGYTVLISEAIITAVFIAAYRLNMYEMK